MSTAQKTTENHKLRRNGIYSITLNKQEQNWYILLRREEYEIREYYKMVQILKHCSTFVLFPEVSKVGRWHYHGRIEITDTYYFHVYAMPLIKKFSHIDLDTIEDDIAWLNYCTKDEEIMRPVIEKLGLPYELTSDLNIESWNYKQEPPRLEREKKKQIEYRQSIFKWMTNIDEISEPNDDFP